MKKENSWKLGCGGRIWVEEVTDYDTFLEKETPAFAIKIVLGEGPSIKEFFMHKSKATIQQLRRMCDWMEKRL